MSAPPLANHHIHAKSVLLVEDSEDYSRPVKRWLVKEGYQVTVAASLSEARQAFDTGHFHAAVIDVCLNTNDPRNRDGIKLLEVLHKMGLSTLIPCVILSASMHPEVILETTQKYNARYVVKQPGYGKELKEELNKFFENKVQINFDLEYEVDTDQLLPQIAEDVKWADNIQPPVDLLTEQLKDIFGRLFLNANRIYIRKLKPGLTGAAILRVEQTGRYGLSPAFVVKIGRQDKIQKEDDNFRDYVKDYIPLASVRVNAAYRRHLGGILYTFMGGGLKSFIEFDDFYAREDASAINESLHNLITSTCAHWYNHREQVRVDLRKEYYEALNLEPARLIERIQSVLPEYEPQAKEMCFPLTEEALINPLAWMEEAENGLDFILPVFRSTTHGDLTGRNIMVDEASKFWLIDFYRTYPSHILRDFVILETDIKYRLMPAADLPGFIRLEKLLLSGDFSKPEIDVPQSLSGDLKKAAGVIHMLHHTAARIAMGVSGEGAVQREYLESLLMTTLNVVRLRHVEVARKHQALYSTHLICQQLQRL